MAASPSIAAADRTDYAVGSMVAGVASDLTFTTIDLIKKPTSKLYGGIELGVNAALAASQFYLAATISPPDEHSTSLKLMYAGVGVWNLALAVHGGYVMLRGEDASPPGMAVSMGGVRGVVVPTAVSDGNTVGAGALFSGSF